jgi:PST family polysaccharide transporter
MMVAGTAVSLILCAVAAPVGGLVDENGFGDIFRSLAMLPLLGALAVVPGAALRREGRHAALVAASVAALAAGGGIASALAWAGAGPWSLVAQIIVQRLVECTVLWGLPGGRIGIAWSRQHFAELIGALDDRALAASLPAVTRYGSCLFVGLALGPTATGLYMLAARVTEALADILLAGEPHPVPRAAVRRACRVALPAVLASVLLAIALPPIVDLCWWGAVFPAQILLLGALPAAIVFVRAACVVSGVQTRWQVVEALGVIAAVGLAAPHGLVAIAVTQLGWITAVALASLSSIGRGLGVGWRAALGDMARPCGGAAAAGVLLCLLSDRVGLALPAVPALCLLTASGWLLYLMIRGEPADAVQPPASARLTPSPADTWLDVRVGGRVPD